MACKRPTMVKTKKMYHGGKFEPCDTPVYRSATGESTTLPAPHYMFFPHQIHSNNEVK
jgi:hypothetical protein